MIDVSTARKAGFWVRVVASIIDAVLMGILSTVLTNAFGQTVGGSLSFIVNVAYLFGFWLTSGQTVGHKIMGLRVIRTDGGVLTPTNAIMRYLGELLSGAAFGIGFIWVAFDANKQGWHDKLAGTYVIHIEEPAAAV
jgi:uncharacterized RDD family membrane protein YckC